MNKAEIIYKELMDKMKRERDLQFKSHKRAHDILVDPDQKMLWQWCYTHDRYEKAGWLS